ncbi:MAG: hypothetical protein KDA63_20900 [Planctomycetales bacterium]|nr:hypothetical protein [Planctomycetales bacterium]
MNSVDISGEDFFSPLATITATLFDPVAAADANGDGVIDGLDYHAWAGRFGETPDRDPAVAATHGDFNLDGRVDGLDYLQWAQVFGGATPRSVPEPSCCWLLVAAAVLFVGVR